MLIIRIGVFILLMVGVTVGMDALMHLYPGLNSPAFKVGDFYPHTSSILWGFGSLFSLWVSLSIK